MDGLTLVTGGAGFIGSHVVDALLTSGSDVRVLDDFSTGKEENLDGAWALAAQGGAGLQVIEGDVRDEVRMRDAVDGCEAVVHLAAVPSVAQSVEDPVGCDSVTHGGTVNAVRQAVEAGAERFVLASSCAVYGDAAQLPIAETTPPRPLSPYAGAKLASEGVCADAADAGQLTAVVPALLQRVRAAPGSRLGLLRRHQPLSLGRGRRRARDHLRRRPPVARLRVRRRRGRRPSCAALQRPLTGVSVLNVGTGRQTDLLQILERRGGAARAGASSGAWSRRARATSVDSRADAGRARWVLGWEAEDDAVPPASPRRGRGSPAPGAAALAPPAETRVSSRRRIQVGAVPVGGGAPVAVQSMTCTRTGDADATLAQVRALEAAGCEIVRVSLPTAEETPAFARVVRERRRADHRRHPLRLAPGAGGDRGRRRRRAHQPGHDGREARARDRAGGGGRPGARGAGRARRPRRRSASASTPARCRATCASAPRRTRPARSSRRRCAGRSSSRSGTSRATSSA